MKLGNRVDKLLYDASLRTAVRIKTRYFRRFVETSNRRLAKTVAAGWDEKARSQEYQETVLPYWKQYGRRPKQFWFDLAGSRDKKMDPRYIPSDLYYLDLVPYINNFPFHWALEDKTYLDIRFPDVKQAGTVCRRIAGEYYDIEMNIIPEEEALRICREHKGELFIKPSIYSAFGSGVEHFVPSESTDSQIKDYFQTTGSNWILQEKIMPHETLSALNPKAVSNVRVLSLFLESRVYISLIYLRVGVKETSHVTVGEEWNAEILPDGHVCTKVWHDGGYWMDAREEGLFDDSLVIPGIDRICDEVRRLHPQVGHLKWIGWDFVIDEEGDPLLIEMNAGPGDHAQRVCGRPLFGEMTDWILEDYHHRRRMESFQARGFWTLNKDIRRYRE